jgi:uncharacterized protein YqjF (DUF2071 family)
MWSALNIARCRREIRYRCRRHWLTVSPATISVTIEIGETILSHEVTQLEHFLTARWRLYTTIGGFLATAPVEHRP